MRAAPGGGTFLDLQVVAAWTTAAAIALPLGLSGPARILLALPLVFLFPGYALLAALYPSRHRVETPRQAEDSTGVRLHGVAPLERFALSVGLSIVVVPLLVLLLDALERSISLPSLLAAVTLTTAAALLVAFLRRRRLPVALRFALPPLQRTPTQAPLPPRELATGILLGAALLAGAVAVGYVHLAPSPAERLTELALLGPEGNLGGYSVQTQAGEPNVVQARVTNREGTPAEYELVATMTPYDPAGHNGTAEPRPTSSPVELQRLSFRLEPGEPRTVPLEFTLPDPGLWRIDVELRRQGEDRVYRTLHLWTWADEGAVTEDPGAGSTP